MRSLMSAHDWHIGDKNTISRPIDTSSSRSQDVIFPSAELPSPWRAGITRRPHGLSVASPRAGAWRSSANFASKAPPAPLRLPPSWGEKSRAFRLWRSEWEFGKGARLALWKGKKRSTWKEGPLFLLLSHLPKRRLHEAPAWAVLKAKSGNRSSIKSHDFLQSTHAALAWNHDWPH